MVFLSNVSLVYEKAANLKKAAFTVCIFICIKIFPTSTGFVPCETYRSVRLFYNL